MSMANPFANWTPAMVEAHNAKQKSAPTPQNAPHFRVIPKANFDRRPCTDEEKLNKTEAAYLAYLRCLNVPLLRIQQITLKIASDCRFTPDFSYLDENGRMVLVDVKGFQREDALIKAKVAARLFTEFRFQIVKRSKGSKGWDVTEVMP